MSKAAKTGCDDTAKRGFHAYAIILIKSGLLRQGNYSHFGASIAPSSRTETHPCLVHGRSFDAVWRSVSAASLLPAITSAPTLGRGSAFLPAQQYLHHSRDAAGAFVPHRSWARSAGHDRSPAPEWCFPGSHGVASLSQSRHSAAVPASVGGSRTGQVASSPRQHADATLAATEASTACHLRYGLHSA